MRDRSARARLRTTCRTSPARDSAHRSCHKSEPPSRPSRYAIESGLPAPRAVFSSTMWRKSHGTAGFAQEHSKRQEEQGRYEENHPDRARFAAIAEALELVGDRAAPD